MGLTFYFNRIGSHRFTTVVSYHSVGAHHELEMLFKANDLVNNSQILNVKEFQVCAKKQKHLSISILTLLYGAFYTLAVVN